MTVEHKLNDKLTLVISAKTDEGDPATLLRIMQETWATESPPAGGLADSYFLQAITRYNQRVLDHPNLHLAMPQIDRPENKSGKKVTRLSNYRHFFATLYSFRLKRPCLVCGQKEVPGPKLSGPQARDLLAPGRNLELYIQEQNLGAVLEKEINGFYSKDKELLQFTRNGELLDLRWCPPWKNDSLFGDEEPDGLRTDLVCPKCIPALLNTTMESFRSQRESEAAQQEERDRQYEEQEKERERLEAIEKQKRRAHEEANPKYVTVTGDIHVVGDFDAQINTRMDAGYRVWGSPVMSADGIIAQAMIRKDAYQSQWQPDKSKGNKKDQRPRREL